MKGGAALALAVLAAPAAAEEWRALDTVEAYAEVAAGREVRQRDRDVHFVPLADGTFAGVSDGLAWSGTWTLRRGMVCYQGKYETGEISYGCAWVRVSGDVLRHEFPQGMGTYDFDMGPRP